MPIRFEQPSPVGQMPNLSVQGGQAEAILKSLPSLASVIGNAMDARASSARAASAAAQANADRQTRYNLGMAEIQQRAMATDAAMEARAAETDAEIQGRMALEDMRLTAQERIRMNQLDQARGRVKQDMADGLIPEEVGRAALYEIETGVNPLKYRDQLTQTKAREQMLKEQEAEAMRTNNLFNMQNGQTLGFWHKTANQIAGIPEPKPGMLQAIPVMGARGELAGEFVIGPDGKQHMNYYKDEKGNADKMFMDADNQARKILATKDPLTGETVQPSEEAVIQKREELLRHMLTFRNQHPELTGARVPGRGVTGAPPEPSMLDRVTGGLYSRGRATSDSPPVGTAPAEMPKGAAPIGKPFNLADPKSMESILPAQKIALGQIDARAEFLKNPLLTPVEREHGAIWVGTMRDLLAAYGDPRAMPPEARAQYYQAQKNFGNLWEGASKRTPSGPAAAGGPVPKWVKEDKYPPRGPF